MSTQLRIVQAEVTTMHLEVPMWLLLTALALAAPASVSPGSAAPGAVDLGDTPWQGIDLSGITGLRPGALPGPSAIINGSPFDESEWPETGALVVKLALQYGNQSFDFVTPVCSSTLIAPDVVLLAAHCIDEFVLNQSLPGNATVKEFAFDRKADLTSYQFGAPYNNGVVAAAEAIVHPDFNVFSFSTNLGVARNDDIALLFLEEPIEDVPFAYLPTAEEADQLLEGNEVVIVGWGLRTPNGQNSGVKYGGDSVINELGKWELQIGATPSDVRKCQGDSGGPTFMPVETDSTAEYRVIGVTSHSYDFTQCESKGGVDTRVDAYLDWIDETMTAGCQDGTRAWCEWEGIIPPPDADGYEAWEENPNEAALADASDSDGSADEKSGGCSTAAGLGSGSGVLLAFGLLGWRRRR